VPLPEVDHWPVVEVPPVISPFNDTIGASLQTVKGFDGLNIVAVEGLSTSTVVVAGGLVQPRIVVVRVYTPLSAVVAFPITGF